MRSLVKMILLLSAALGSGLFSVTASACPGEKYEVHHVALDSDGVVTRTETREVPAPDFDVSQKTVWTTVIVDRIKLESGDEVKLNAAPGMMDASVHLVVKRHAQKADRDGIFYTTYSVREIWTSGWGAPRESEKLALVTVKSAYLGDGKRGHGCGSVVVKNRPSLPFFRLK